MTSTSMRQHTSAEFGLARDHPQETQALLTQRGCLLGISQGPVTTTLNSLLSAGIVTREHGRSGPINGVAPDALGSDEGPARSLCSPPDTMNLIRREPARETSDLRPVSQP